MLGLILLAPQSRFGDKLIKIQLIRPQYETVTAVLKGLTYVSYITH